MYAGVIFAVFAFYIQQSQAITVLFHDESLEPTSEDAEQITCYLYGDTTLYGTSVRVGFYLQWVASLLALLFAKNQYSGNRIAGVAAIWALLISSIQGSLNFQASTPWDTSTNATSYPLMEWAIVFYLVIGLFVANVPLGKAQVREASGTYVAIGFAGCVAFGAQFHLYWTDLHNQGIWGPLFACDTKLAFLAPFSRSSNGWVIFNKIVSFIACFVYIPLFFIFAVRLLIFNLRYGGYENTYEDSIKKPSHAMRYVVAVLVFISGVISIASVEVMVAQNKINWKEEDAWNWNLTVELMSLFAGITCLISVLWEIGQKHWGRSLQGTAPPPPNFWSTGGMIKMARLRK